MKTASIEEPFAENEDQQELRVAGGDLEQIQEIKVISKLGDPRENCLSPEIDAAGMFSEIHDMNQVYLSQESMEMYQNLKSMSFDFGPTRVVNLEKKVSFDIPGGALRSSAASARQTVASGPKIKTFTFQAGILDEQPGEGGKLNDSMKKTWTLKASNCNQEVNDKIEKSTSIKEVVKTETKPNGQPDTKKSQANRKLITREAPSVGPKSSTTVNSPSKRAKKSTTDRQDIPQRKQTEDPLLKIQMSNDHRTPRGGIRRQSKGHENDDLKFVFDRTSNHTQPPKKFASKPEGFTVGMVSKINKTKSRPLGQISERRNELSPAAGAGGEEEAKIETESWTQADESKPVSVCDTKFQVQVVEKPVSLNLVDAEDEQEEVHLPT